jgi:hypothetical protein
MVGVRSRVLWTVRPVGSSWHRWSGYWCWASSCSAVYWGFVAAPPRASPRSCADRARSRATARHVAPVARGKPARRAQRLALLHCSVQVGARAVCRRRRRHRVRSAVVVL